MSTSDTALDWLISLSAACTSSPIPTTSSPDFTEWLRKSPRFDQSSPNSSQLCASSPALKDVSFSSRVNMDQLEDLGLNYAYDLSGQGGENDMASLTEPSAASSRCEAQRSSAPIPFSQHNRMISLQSTSATLVNTPSPHFRSPSGHIWRSYDRLRSPYPSSVFYSPATKFVQELQDVSFGSSFSGFSSTSLQAETLMSDISPVVRAENAEMPSQLPNALSKCQKMEKKRKGKKSTKSKAPQTFLEKLTRIPLPANPPNTPAPANLVSDHNICSQNSSTTGLTQPILLSPCKITSAPIQAYSSDAHLLEPALTPALPTVHPDRVEDTDQGLPSTPLTRASAPVQALTPLTPLTPLPESSSPVPAPPLKLTLRLKRPQAPPETPPRRSKRARCATFIAPSPSPSQESQDDQPASPERSLPNAVSPTFTNRTLPSTIAINPTFSLFYRRFPASSYYQAADTDSPCSLFGVGHPGGVYNIPRNAFDLYTPRFVRGKGTEKVGLCPICVEPPERGGESKKLWLAMKFSAFKCYHMQCAHGISASTGRPFSPPTAFRVVPRVNPGKKEKTELMRGKCHKCARWVPIEGIKDMESKVKELHWWKHAASCHQESSLSGEYDYYEDDEIYKKLSSL
ncbi:hypothetical protein D9619_008882 [Psilocybe cf. subviscida]|uniref:Transcription regulator Rua1 C-terminal domain-containing protein n=1 Tax=Psilocybe cf. subviscida TaxID=2480587 RepID=A0A8H5BC28_9AGAR|nr:hypothetical protein D9619_008882 [Psilocybe cf. subviscida]